MSKIMSKEMVRLIGSANKKGTSPYDTQAEIVRIEGATAWVHIPGGVDETPVRMTMSAKPGDVVQVRVSGGRAWLTGNASSPPTDNTEAFRAQDIAFNAKVLAEASEREAKRAKEAADNAEEAAGTARTKAAEAETAAGEAKESAQAAGKAAAGALSQLSIVEDVVGTLNWISEHGQYEPSEDTEVQPGKHYFIVQNGIFVIVIDPHGSPAEQGYYELSSVDEAVANFVSSHLALTDAGLWVTKDNRGYRVLLANDGMKVFDDKGNILASFGENAVIGQAEGWHQRINSEETVFAYGDTVYTYLTPGKILTENMEVNGSYYVGDYSVRVANDGKLVIGRRK